MQPAVRRIAKCSRCKRDTNHEIKAKHVFVEREEWGEDQIIELDHEYMIIQCAGCDRVSFLDLVPYDEGIIAFQYPTPLDQELEGKVLEEAERWQLPHTIGELYHEVERTLKADANLIAGLGLRTLVEAICLHQKISGRNLKDKIEGLKIKGLISENELPILDKLRLLGNDSAHKIKAMDEVTLMHALQIVNHVIRSIYILPLIGKKIKTAKPRKK